MQAPSISAPITLDLQIRLCPRVVRELDPLYPSNPWRDHARKVESHDRQRALLSYIATHARVLGARFADRQLRLLLPINGDWRLLTGEISPGLDLVITHVDGGRYGAPDSGR